MKTLKLNPFLIVVAFIGAIALPPFIFSALVDRKESTVETKMTESNSGAKQDAPIGDEPSEGQSQNPPFGDVDNSSRSEQDVGIPVPAGSTDIATARWRSYENIEDEYHHLALECPYCLSPNEYPATTCRSCGKSYHITAVICGKCKGAGNIPCDFITYDGMRKCSEGKLNGCPKCKDTRIIKCWYCRGRGRFAADTD